jgi:hypothetical protein
MYFGIIHFLPFHQITTTAKDFFVFSSWQLLRSNASPNTHHTYTSSVPPLTLFFRGAM